jgi:hypothetical protein
MTFKGAIMAAAAACVLAGLTAIPGQAQVGPTYVAPVPDGLKAGTGAPFPKGRYKDLDKLPDWGGVWFHTFPRPGAGASPARPPAPALKGKYKTEYEAWRQAVKENHGVVKSAVSHCTPPGMPGIMSLPQYPYEFLFTPGRVTINQEAWMQTRHIWTDGRAHPDDPNPGFFGHSIGHWEGDTLVADTVGIKDSVPLGMGMNHSDKLHVTERIHLKAGDPDTLLDEITVEDPDALEHPYTITATYHRDRYAELLEFQCAENDRNPVNEHGDTEFQ